MSTATAKLFRSSASTDLCEVSHRRQSESSLNFCPVGGRLSCASNDTVKCHETNARRSFESDSTLKQHYRDYRASFNSSCTDHLHYANRSSVESGDYWQYANDHHRESQDHESDADSDDSDFTVRGLDDLSTAEHIAVGQEGIQPGLSIAAIASGEAADEEGPPGVQDIGGQPLLSLEASWFDEESVYEDETGITPKANFCSRGFHEEYARKASRFARDGAALPIWGPGKPLDKALVNADLATHRIDSRNPGPAADAWRAAHTLVELALAREDDRSIRLLLLALRRRVVSIIFDIERLKCYYNPDEVSGGAVLRAQDMAQAERSAREQMPQVEVRGGDEVPAALVRLYGPHAPTPHVQDDKNEMSQLRMKRGFREIEDVLVTMQAEVPDLTTIGRAI